jgi:hypothetical protein
LWHSSSNTIECTKLAKEIRSIIDNQIFKLLPSIYTYNTYFEERNHVRLNVGETQEAIYLASRTAPINPHLKPCYLYKSENNFKNAAKVNHR